ncbi:MAG: hypothetical protein COU69_04445 [Candidatus Pacebacteria bacterium CG10_big_fil_rev_8_21_14_0_10_56_10]|nr:MAG: hypothetical protein COU69_04445 [Candidatus Pacebacteria bacterium CG10_big_fil_rev_8_21_14_0_10_56_10]
MTAPNSSNSSLILAKIVKGGSTIFFFSLLVSPLGYLIRLLYSRTLSIEDVGLFYAVIGLINFLSAYNDLGFGFSVSYFVPKFIKDKNYQKVWTTYKYGQYLELGTSFVLSLILILLSPWLASNFFKQPEAEQLVYLLVVYFLAQSFLASLSKLFNGLQQEKFYASIQFTKLLFTLIFSVIVWLLGVTSATWYAASWAVGYSLAAVLYALVMKKTNKYLVSSIIWDPNLFRKMFKFALPALLGTTITSFIYSTDTIFLTWLRGVREVGIYGVVFALATVSDIFVSPINSLFFPMISQLSHDRDDANIKKIIGVVVKVIPLVSIYFGFFLFIFPASPIQILFGERWVAASEVPLRWAVLSTPFITLTSYLTTILGGLGMVKERLRLAAMVAVANILLGISLTSVFGLIGTLAANIIVYFFSMVLHIILLKKVVDFNLPYFFILQTSVFLGIIFLLTMITNFYPVSVVDYIAAGIVYSLFFLLFAVITKTINLRQTVMALKS